MGYTLITSDEGLADLRARFIDHDAVLKEVHVVASEYIPLVSARHQLEWSPYPNARLLVQVMWPQPSAFEFILLHVVEMSIAADCSGGVARQDIMCDWLHTKGRLEFCVCGGYFLVEQILWREVPGWLGVSARLGSEIPVSSNVAPVMDDDWVICPSCSDGWQLERIPQFRKCPSCGQVCEILREGN
ncbi:MAG: hypothetical protein K1Y02_04865 [Candidatus Hydrogenedentes bacterium]|nr:hypothetical protein [Candidatus Hydrogenedentota bacterium]